MRLLLLSDIHANATALAAVLAAAEGHYERAVCLGDLVGYGPDPDEVIDTVRSIATVVIRGNHDRAACGLTDLEDFNPVAAAAIAWTRSRLSETHAGYLRQLPSGPVETDGVVLVHGSPRDEDEYIFTAAQAHELLRESTHPVTFFGHTHLQGGFSFSGEFLQVILLRAQLGSDYAALRMEPGARLLLNPGSVGQPRDSDSRAGFAIADLDHNVVEFWRVPYDIRAVQERMTALGAPEMLIDRLARGA